MKNTNFSEFREQICAAIDRGVKSLDAPDLVKKYVAVEMKTSIGGILMRNQEIAFEMEQLAIQAGDLMEPEAMHEEAARIVAIANGDLPEES